MKSRNFNRMSGFFHLPNRSGYFPNKYRRIFLQLSEIEENSFKLTGSRY
jgi:hypothetical protein